MPRIGGKLHRSLPPPAVAYAGLLAEWESPSISKIGLYSNKFFYWQFEVIKTAFDRTARKSSNCYESSGRRSQG